MCQWCNREFMTEYLDALYCSNTCRGRARENRRKGRVRPPRCRGTVPEGVLSQVKICKWCGELFDGVITAEYCSNSCFSKARHSRRKIAGKPSHSKASRKNQKRNNKLKAKDFVYVDKILKGCSHCPERRPHTLDYHHLDRSTKKECVSVLMNSGASISSIVAETAKCILLCRNCHAVEERGDGYRPEDRPHVG